MAFLLFIPRTHLDLATFAARAVQAALPADPPKSERPSNKVHILIEKARAMRRFNPLLQMALEPKGSYIYGIKQGDIIGNRYEVREVLDSGATGNVHKVFDTQTGKTFAIKSLREGVHKRTFIRRFIREGSTLARLNHENIVSIEDMGWDKNRPFIILEYVAGGNFKGLMERFHRGEFDLNTMLHYVADVCDGLDELHSKKIVHRDLKPSNIMVSDEIARDILHPRQKVKITDFGLVRINSADLNMSTVSQLTNSENRPFGTPYYTAVPDLLNPGIEIDGRADLYSLGILLYEVLMKKLPFASDDLIALHQQHLHEQPDFSTIPINAPSRLISLIDKLLAKHPSDRYQRASEVATELRSIATPRLSASGLAQLIVSKAG